MTIGKAKQRKIIWEEEKGDFKKTKWMLIWKKKTIKTTFRIKKKNWRRFCKNKDRFWKNKKDFKRKRKWKTVWLEEKQNRKKNCGI